MTVILQILLTASWRESDHRWRSTRIPPYVSVNVISRWLSSWIFFIFFGLELKAILMKLPPSLLGTTKCLSNRSIVLLLCLSRAETDWRQLDISIRAKALRDYQKRPFQSFSSTSPLSCFAYEHSPKYPHKRLMSLCSCILPFIGWETMHQSVRLLPLIHTAHENAVMPQENVYW